MNTTYRCATRAFAVAAVTLAVTLAASAQAVRNFPPNALRGAVTFGDFPQITLNGQTTQLSPGSRIRDQSNRLVLPATLNGGKALVNYTVAQGEGQVQDVWILRPEEAAIRPWPQTLEQARTWSYDATTQTWTKP